MALFVIIGKLAGLLVNMYNIHPLVERGNNSQNCAYYTLDFTVIKL